MFYPEDFANFALEKSFVPKVKFLTFIACIQCKTEIPNLSCSYT